MDCFTNQELNKKLIISSDERQTLYLLNDNDCMESDVNLKLNVNIDDESGDTCSELKFDDVVETEQQKSKKELIKAALSSQETNLKYLQKLAIDEYGLVNDNLRRKVWPLLLGVDPNPSENAPLLSELSNHSEYNQVVLDVNRSLKRFPPGIPYKQRLALQDQLTVLILRVIMKYPHLQYYQGYHDVAITFLLVVGETVAFRIMERLSTDHLRECMEPTMESTSYRLQYIYPLLERVDHELYNFMDSASVGIMFALPWYLTWFGHSLNQYHEVVRLYDYFLASQPLMPIYVATSLVIERRQHVFESGCDMASIHCILSQIPDNLNFENILKRASKLYYKYPPKKLEKAVKSRIQKLIDQRKKEEMLMQNRINKNKTVWLKLSNYLPTWFILNYRGKYSLIFATATVLIGIYAYVRTSENGFSFIRGSIVDS